jgi:two-component system response regulator AtoC
LDGEKGLQSLSQFDPDVVIIDVRMPKMDGLEMLEQMRGPECDCRCRKIVLSANTPEKTRIAALALGVDYFVKKPFEFDSLDKLIRSLIQEPEPAHA